MKRFMLLALLPILMGCSSGDAESHKKPDAMSGHDMQKEGSPGDQAQPGTMLMIRTEPATPAAGQPTTLQLMIHDAEGSMLADFEVVHEQKVHLIIVRDGLDQFAHLHPEVAAAGGLTARYTFPTGGTYRLYADHQPKGKARAVAIAELRVTGDTPVAATLIRSAPGKVTGDGIKAQVAIRKEAGVENMTRIQFDLFDDADRPLSELQPYMGAMGHLVVLSSNGKEYVHAHPADEKQTTGSVVAFEAHFMKPGLYKGWAQFSWRNETRVIPFVMNVD